MFLILLFFSLVIGLPLLIGLLMVGSDK